MGVSEVAMLGLILPAFLLMSGPVQNRDTQKFLQKPPVADKACAERQAKFFQSHPGMPQNTPAYGGYYTFRESPNSREFVVYAGPLGKGNPGDLQMVNDNCNEFAPAKPRFLPLGL